MDPYTIVILCWLSGVFLTGLWSRDNSVRPSGYYVIRNSYSYSPLSIRYLPVLTGIPNRVPLFCEGDIWRYRYPGGPWIYPQMSALIEHGQTESGDPLVEE
jgi:hypothetical protein